MILVLCINSAVDKTLVVPGFRLGRLFRPAQTKVLAGGKGINVARVLRRFRVPVRVIGVAAGDTGRSIRGMLRAEGIPAEWVSAKAGRSRTCLAVVDGRGGRPTEINEHGPALTRAELRAFERRVLAALPRAQLLVAAGSLPPGVPDGFYRRLIARARAKGVPSVLDTSGRALAEGLAARPALVKINDEEAASIGLAVASRRGRRRALARLLRVAQRVVVTRGRKGLFAAASERDGRRFWTCKPPRVRTLCPIGSGDTLLAGLIVGWRRGWTAERCLRFATALAAANTLVLGAGLFRDADRRRIEPRVRARPGV